MTSQSQQIRQRYEGTRLHVPEARTKAEALRVLSGRPIEGGTNERKESTPDNRNLHGMRFEGHLRQRHER